MQIVVSKRDAAEIAKLHPLFRQKANCQIIHDSFWARGWVDAYAIEVDGRLAGYGGVATKYDLGNLIEFYAFPAFEADAMAMGRELISVSGATHIEAQTNLPWMPQLLEAFGEDASTGALLFSESKTTKLVPPEGAHFCRFREDAGLTRKDGKPAEGPWVVEMEGFVVASGGVLTHYNPPYGDIYMEVDEAYRQRGIGSYLVQELKRVAYEAGNVPAARCNAANASSRKTLERAGFAMCGEMKLGKVRAR